MTRNECLQTRRFSYSWITLCSLSARRSGRRRSSSRTVRKITASFEGTTKRKSRSNPTDSSTLAFRCSSAPTLTWNSICSREMFRWVLCCRHVFRAYKSQLRVHRPHCAQTVSLTFTLKDLGPKQVKIVESDYMESTIRFENEEWQFLGLSDTAAEFNYTKTKRVAKKGGEEKMVQEVEQATGFNVTIRFRRHPLYYVYALRLRTEWLWLSCMPDGCRSTLTGSTWSCRWLSCRSSGSSRCSCPPAPATSAAWSSWCSSASSCSRRRWPPTRPSRISRRTSPSVRPVFNTSVFTKKVNRWQPVLSRHPLVARPSGAQPRRLHRNHGGVRARRERLGPEAARARGLRRAARCARATLALARLPVRQTAHLQRQRERCAAARECNGARLVFQNADNRWSSPQQMSSAARGAGAQRRTTASRRRRTRGRRPQRTARPSSSRRSRRCRVRRYSLASDRGPASIVWIVCGAAGCAEEKEAEEKKAEADAEEKKQETEEESEKVKIYHELAEALNSISIILSVCAQIFIFLYYLLPITIDWPLQPALRSQR